MRKSDAILLTPEQRLSSSKNWATGKRGMNLLMIADCRSTNAEITAVVKQN